jgi:hypothetical protein
MLVVVLDSRGCNISTLCSFRSAYMEFWNMFLFDTLSLFQGFRSIDCSF